MITPDSESKLVPDEDPPTAGRVWADSEPVLDDCPYACYDDGGCDGACMG